MTSVTFGASGLDRAAHWRTEEAKIVDALADGAGVLPVWRGKIALQDGVALAWFPRNHSLFDGALESSIFLGLDDGRPRFALDISHWDPKIADGTLETFFDPSVQVHPLFPEGTGFFELRSIMTALTSRDAEIAATARAVTAWHATHRFCARCGGPSEIIEAGWQRRCTTCGARHFPRTDPVVITLVTHGNDLLLGRSTGWPDGLYSLLAGFVEPGETIEAAAAREVFEEAGIQLGPVRYLACQPWPFPASLMFGLAAEATSRDITVDPVELEDARWLSREEVLETLIGAHKDVKPARAGAIARTMIEDWLAGRTS